MAKAIVKAGKAGKQRAAFAIEGAIEDTRRRIAGSAKDDLQKKALAALAGSPRLTTEADGRKFAIALLEKFEKLDPGARFSSWSAQAEGPDGDGLMMIFRQSAQTDIAKRACDAIYQATEEARNGFFVVLTDFIGSELEQGGKDSERYRDLEKAGELEPWGSMVYKHPAKVVEAIAAGETCYRIGKAPKAKALKAQKQAEEKAKGPLVEAGQAEAIEQFLQSSGPWRRAAMVFLEKPYAEMAGYIKTEKKTAEAFAEIAAELAKWKENYMTIILRLTHAESDMRRAISERKDGAAILQWAKQLVKTEKAFR